MFYKPMVSIFCNCKNAERTIRRHIESVLEAIKSYDNIEYVVQDGKSTDTTLQIFNEYADRFEGKLKLVSEADSSAAEGFWRALSRCRSDIVCASLADEELLPDAIPFTVKYFEQHPEVDVIHGNIYQTDVDGNIQFINYSRKFDAVEYLSHKLPMHLAASFFRKRIFDEAGLLSEHINKYGFLADDFFIWAYLGNTKTISYVDKVFAKYAVHDSAASVASNRLLSIASSRLDFLNTYFRLSDIPQTVRNNQSDILKNVISYWIHAFDSAGLHKEATGYRKKMAKLSGTEEATPVIVSLKSACTNKKVLLLSLPGLNTGDEPIFPLGIGYLLAALRQDERPAQALHYQRSEHVCAQLPEVMQQYAPDIVGLTCTTFNRGLVHKTCAWLRANYPHIRIVLGGVHVSFMYQQVLQDYEVDYVVIGEGEHTLRELCTALDQNLPLHGINGIAFLQDGQVVTTPPRETVQNLDDLPMPDYSFAGDLMRRSGMGFVISSRGCPVQCNFCSTSSYWGQKVRMNSPRRIVDEMEALVADYGVKKIFFHDDTFNLGIGRVKEICSEITSRGLNVEWGVSCRVSPVSEEMIDTMVAAGCRHICWGIESGSKAMLARIGKRITQEQITKAFECSRKHLGVISVGAFTMVGNPGESAGTIAESTKFIGSLQMTDPPSTAVLYILPGTKLYAELLTTHPEFVRFWSVYEEVPYYTLEHPMETLAEWARQIGLSAALVPFDRKKHFWNNVLFGAIPQPNPPALTFLDSELASVIPPEIKNDELYEVLKQLAKNEMIQTVLEIGSSAGGGSTEAFVTGLSSNKQCPQLYCMEVSKPRFDALHKRYADIPFVHCYNVSSVPIALFPSAKAVEEFYRTTMTGLNAYPLERVLGWLYQDIDYIRSAGVPQDGIEKIKRENGIEQFDLVLIDGSEFTGIAELEQVYGARWLLLDDINAYKNYHNYQQLKNDSAYELYRENWQLRNGYAIFRKREETLPIHFFTIVLNGEPFIRYHIDVLKQLPFKWHWHIIEGVAEHKYDTAWSLQFGGRVAESLHNNGLSNDGTTVYLDELKQKYPELITVYRKPAGMLWGGKVEMVSAPLSHINEECLLWQLDVDELWTTQQFQDAHALFQQHPDRMAAHYWCWFFVGPAKVVSSRYCYSQNPRQEWLRTWRYLPGMAWAAHEPPQLVVTAEDGSLFDVGHVNPFLHDETERAGLVFQHYAYALESQLAFKQTYYGYRDAVAGWRKLQLQQQFPVYLKDYFSWVHDNTCVDTAGRCKVEPLLRLASPRAVDQAGMPKIIVDGVIFQLYTSGIARVWQTLFRQWLTNGFAASLLVLDRAGTAPRLEGIAYRDVKAYNYDATDQDRQMLQQICDEEQADLFVSSYYTTPLVTTSVFYAHDMIPEKTTYFDLNHPFWREKHYGIRHATHFIAVSRNTACDLVSFYPQAEGRITIAPNAVETNTFYPASTEEQRLFVQSCGITKPYFLIVGGRISYKNVRLFFEAFAKLPDKHDYEIVCCGGAQQLEPEFAKLVTGTTVHLVSLSDAGLRAAYSLALAYVYPSAYEGFGLTMLEAMACNCPVITCHNSALPEVAGAAALYVDEIDPQEMLAALQQVQQPAVRSWLIQAGQQQLQKFSWHKTAQVVQETLTALCNRISRHD